MKKALLLAALFTLVYSSGIGQQVFYSGFESWTTTHKPTGWFGVATSIDSNSVNQYTTSPFEGTYSVKLTNNTTSHKRLSTTGVSVTAGQAYNVSYYVKGNGSIRSGMYKGATGRYVSYSAYDSVNTTTWVKIVQVIISDTTAPNAEFILSLRNTQTANEDIQVDSVSVTIATVTTVPIHDIQYTTADTSSYYGDVVNTGGIVTAVYPTKGYYIQNGSGPWSGVYVYNSSNTPSIGDSITFSASVTEYYGLTELQSVSNYTVVSSGNALHLTELTLDVAGEEMYEGVYSHLTNVQCTSLPDSYLEWVVGDGLNSLKIGDALYAYTPTLNTYYDITGVMDYNFSERKLLPRSAADVTIHNGIEENSISSSVYPNPADGYVTVNAATEGIMQVSDMTGSIVFASAFNHTATINVSELESGIYNVTINGNNGEFAISKLIVK